MVNLLATYVGRDAVRADYGGRRPSAETSPHQGGNAARDLRGFSRLTDELPEQRIIELLNAFSIWSSLASSAAEVTS